MRDISDFTSAETRTWYLQHCIPLRRGYLLHGPPGTGKSSIVRAIATRLQRSLHRLSLVGKGMNDDVLVEAINHTHDAAIFVVEDVDALFDTHREKKDHFGVTFSGLLAALDSGGDKEHGTIFLVTSNHPDRLDPALRRKGRMDVDVRFGYVTDDIARRMFLRFYPGDDAAASLFARQVDASGGSVTCADLQHHFILNRGASSADAAMYASARVARPDAALMFA